MRKDEHFKTILKLLGFTFACVLGLTIVVKVSESIRPPPSEKGYLWTVYVKIQRPSQKTRDHAVDIVINYFNIDYKAKETRWELRKSEEGILISYDWITIYSILDFGDYTTFYAIYPTWQNDVYYHQYPRVYITLDKNPEVRPAW